MGAEQPNSFLDSKAGAKWRYQGRTGGRGTEDDRPMEDDAGRSAPRRPRAHSLVRVYTHARTHTCTHAREGTHTQAKEGCRDAQGVARPGDCEVWDGANRRRDLRGRVLRLHVDGSQLPHGPHKLLLHRTHKDGRRVVDDSQPEAEGERGVRGVHRVRHTHAQYRPAHVALARPIPSNAQRRGLLIGHQIETHCDRCEHAVAN
mmetsp:Transcript_76299/g.204977  ORF Transcript_76299/g.204977 Transcript_76299/m.204977 type:complete len:203 (+) Transcript_76299:102-710(+)